MSQSPPDIQTMHSGSDHDLDPLEATKATAKAYGKLVDQALDREITTDESLASLQSLGLSSIQAQDYFDELAQRFKLRGSK
ncbi:hypothetical protein H0H87_000784, partial [Tephrocybe sp. NHM501043]